MSTKILVPEPALIEDTQNPVMMLTRLLAQLLLFHHSAVLTLNRLLRGAIMGRTSMYIGFSILVLGVGPLLLASMLAGVSPNHMFSNSLGLGLLAVFSIWPGILLTSAGILMCMIETGLNSLLRWMADR